MKKTKVIKVDYLARVEGEGALYLKIQGKKLTDVQLKNFRTAAVLRGFPA